MVVVGGACVVAGGACVVAGDEVVVVGFCVVTASVVVGLGVSGFDVGCTDVAGAGVAATIAIITLTVKAR